MPRSILSAIDAAETVTSPLPVLDLAAWEGQPKPVRQWAWRNIMPLRQTTMLTGSGGTGKSLLAQQLGTAIAAGLPCMGRETRQVSVLYITAEDDADELHCRHKDICDALGINRPFLIGKMHLVSLCGSDGNALATFTIDKKLTVTDRWKAIEAYCSAHEIGFVVIDNASHAMVGEHNDLASVTAFINLLNGLALAIDGSVLLIHHTNKAGADWLGSVAWENALRARIVMKRDEVDRDLRTLEVPKANYAEGGRIAAFRWHKGAFMRDEDLPADVAAGLAETAQASFDNDIFLACLAERNRQGRHVSERPGANFAPKEFAEMAESKGIGKARLKMAMDRLFRINKIERATLGRNKDKARAIEGLRPVEVPPNATPNASPNVPQTAPEPTPYLPPNRPPTHSPPTEGYGTALGAAVPPLNPSPLETAVRR